MKLLHFLAISMFLALGCNTVSADSCRPNTTGGAGGAATIPIGAGVGATTSGDFPSAAPPSEPLDYGGDDNPCVSPSATPRIGECKVTWRAGSPPCPGPADCVTEYQTSKKYTDLEAVKADCENANGVGNGSGAKACTCGWLDPPVTPATAYYHGWCYEGAYKWELWANFKDVGACVAEVERRHHCDPGTAKCEKVLEVNATYYCNGDSVCETTDDPPKITGGCTYSNHQVNAGSPGEAVDKANVECAIKFQKAKAPGRAVYCKSSNLVCTTGGNAPN